MSVLTGSCRCGETTFEVADVDPMFSGFCHCSRCRRTVGAPCVHVLGLPSDTWKVTKNEDKVLRYVHTDRFHVISCGICGQYTDLQRLTTSGGPVANLPQGAPFVGVYPTLLDKYRGEFPQLEEKHKPTTHLWYSNRILDVHDALPKFLDFPAPYGGSGNLYEPPSEGQ
jgi:hypothetical protein